jgi:hypothetical protein
MLLRLYLRQEGVKVEPCCSWIWHSDVVAGIVKL